jgi:hypothetical protein
MSTPTRVSLIIEENLVSERHLDPARFLTLGARGMAMPRALTL